MIASKDQIFDTLLDTNKIYVSMKDKFSIRNYKNAEGKSPISLPSHRKSNPYKFVRAIFIPCNEHLIFNDKLCIDSWKKS